MVDQDGLGSTGLTFVKSRRDVYQGGPPIRDAGNPRCRLECGCRCVALRGPAAWDLEHRTWTEMTARGRSDSVIEAVCCKLRRTTRDYDYVYTVHDVNRPMPFLDSFNAVCYSMSHPVSKRLIVNLAITKRPCR